MSIDIAYAPKRDFTSRVRRRVTQWRAMRPATLRFDAPILSISFDDFPASAAREGARIVERNGGRATYYAAADMAEKESPCGFGFSPADLSALSKAGHEIGCHTFGHVDCAQRETYDTLLDIAQNRDTLADMGFGRTLTSFAYPYGETTTALKSALPPRFTTARGILPGLNAGRTDLAQLRAYALFGDDWIATVDAALTRAAKRKAWMIGFTHDVCDTPSPWGTTPEALDALLTAAKSHGFQILTVTAALERAR